jgi:hypothetical protein
VLTSIQAAVVIWERRTGFLLIRDTSFLKLGFLVPDPGLAREFGFGGNRIGGSGRPVATSPHPIVLSALIGLAIVVTLAVRSYLGTRTRLVLLILFLPLMASLLALETRTGIVIIVVAGAATFGLVLWRKTVDTLPIVLAAGLVLLATVGAFPASARTVLNQFSRIGSDPSIAGRVVDIPVLPELVARRPILGAGYMTLNPELVIFDNSYYGGLVEFGVMGFGVLLAFLIMATLKPLCVLRLASDRDTPILIAGFSAGVSLLIGMATFDAMFFAQFFPSALILVAMGLGRTDAITRRAGGAAVAPGNALVWRVVRSLENGDGNELNRSRDA